MHRVLHLIQQRQNVLRNLDNDVSLEEDKIGQMFFKALTIDFIFQVRALSSEIRL